VTTGEGVKGKLWSINEQLDDSVILRWKNDLTYRPRSPVNYFRRNAGQV